MAKRKQIIGGDYISRGRKLSVSKAVRAGDFVYLTGQVPRELTKHAPVDKIHEIEIRANDRGVLTQDVRFGHWHSGWP